MTINAFPGYTYVKFGEDNQPHNLYRGEDVGFGGYVWAQPGMYGRTVCFDVAGMHPSSIRALNYLGEYTKNYADLVEARTAIKHKDFEAAKKMLDGKLAPFLTDEQQAKDLSKALKLAQNSVYGLTSAKFANPFRDPRNDNNIVALRGALFMVNLKNEIQDRGFTVIHCKTDSCKVVNPSDELCDFIMDYGKQYGYNFEIEHIFERICLVNNAVYIAKLADDDPEAPGQWTATGTQFQVPYVFKKLFSKEPIEFEDLCETKEVKQSAIYLDMNENLPEGEHDYHFIGKVSSFCPIKPGCGGADLVRTSTDKNGNVKYDSVTGTKGYRWLEAEAVKALGKQDDIDRRYYDELVNAAIYGKGNGKDRKPGISDFGDFERFVADEPYIDIPTIDHPLDDTPPWYTPEELEAIAEAEREGIPFYITPELAKALDENAIDDTFRKR